VAASTSVVWGGVNRVNCERAPARRRPIRVLERLGFAGTANDAILVSLQASIIRFEQSRVADPRYHFVINVPRGSNRRGCGRN
jgi:hypothetical protein